MNLSILLSLIEQDSAYRELVNKLTEPAETESKLVISDAAKSYLIAALYQNVNLPVLVVTLLRYHLLPSLPNRAGVYPPSLS